MINPDIIHASKVIRLSHLMVSLVRFLDVNILLYIFVSRRFFNAKFYTTFAIIRVSFL